MNYSALLRTAALVAAACRHPRSDRDHRACRPVAAPARRDFPLRCAGRACRCADQSRAARRGTRPAEERRRADRRPQPEPGHRRRGRPKPAPRLPACRSGSHASSSSRYASSKPGRADAADERAETRLFSALDGAFRDVPPSRIAGAVMITDGQVHDVPASAKNFPAPLHALITGDEDERDRRIRFENAPRFGLVGKPLEMSYRVIVGQWRGRTGRCAGLDQRPAGVDAARHDRPGDAARDRHSRGRTQYRRTGDRPRRRRD